MQLSMIKAELIDQYMKCQDGIDVYKNEIKKHCVKGYVSSKKINGKTYHYLQWTENGKIHSKYIKAAHLEALKVNIAQRKEYEKHIKEMKKSIKEIEIFVGVDVIKEAINAIKAKE
ncbi:MAG: hypothetical protein K6E98_04295 [Lachnospiraceae bacterium]|nr:hypothetical protein [Lachnospiraceae bacterium]